MKQYVIYTRVSTAKQGESGLGLDAQLRDIDLYLTNYSDQPYETLATFTDIESGANSARPQLKAAIDLVRSTGAELLVAKLDRLSRRVSFIAQIMEDKRVKLRVASMPQADNFQLHIYAALAEQERDFISKRTIAALAAAKVKHEAQRKIDPTFSKQIGGLRDKTMKRNAAWSAKAAEHAAKVWEVIKPMHDAGKSLRAIAGALEELEVATVNGGRWEAATVARAIARMKAKA